MRKRAHVFITASSDGEEMKIKSIVIASEYLTWGGDLELVFEWFRMTGRDYPAAYKNCVESIAFHLHCCEDQILPFAKALSPPALADEVSEAMARINPKWARRG